MGSVKRICVLQNADQARLLENYLTQENVPHKITSNGDSVYDGIWQLQAGWGYVEAPAEYENIILEIYEGLKNKTQPLT